MSKSLIQRWREGELARSSTASTVVLGICLAATLLAAFALVADRSGILVARQNGSEVIQQVRQQGLDTYLGQSNQVMYYLLEEDNQANGYRVLYMHRDVKNGRVVYKELWHYPSLGLKIHTLFSITNDLSEYDYSKVTQNNQKKVSFAKHEYRNGELFNGRRREFIPQDGNNIVPVFLLDFFSSLSTRDFPKKGAAFSFALLDQDRNKKIFFEECWVQSGGKISEKIKATLPKGRLVTVNWNPSDPTSQGLISQTIYYNMNHQLIWQKSITATSEEIQRTITPEELDRIYPGSRGELADWLGDIQSDETKQII